MAATTAAELNGFFAPQTFVPSQVSRGPLSGDWSAPGDSPPDVDSHQIP